MRYLVVALVLAGCTDYTDRCKRIVDHTIEVGVRELSVGMSEADKHRLVADVESRRAGTMEACEKGKPAQEDTECALRGQKLAEINSCAWYREAGVGGVR